MDKWTKIYRGWFLQCEPQKLADGRFDPRLVMQAYNAGTTTEITIRFKDAPIFDTAEEAFDYAIQKGMEQVDSGKV